MVVVGFTEGRIPSVQVNRLLFRNVDVVGAAWGAFLAAEPGMFAAAQRELERMIEQGAVAAGRGARLRIRGRRRRAEDAGRSFGRGQARAPGSSRTRR